METTTNTTITNDKPFDETDELALYFNSTINGDIYNKKTNELICTSGRQHIVVRSKGCIHEKVSETNPCFDGTLIRAFYFNDKWHLATRKKIDAFKSSWTQSQSFGELFEEISKAEVEYLTYSLNQNFSYSFLLLSPKVTNVLFNSIAELIFVSVYDRKKQVWESVSGESFQTIACQRPPFANRIVKSDVLPRFDTNNEPPKSLQEKIQKENELMEKTFNEPQRNQRGWLYIGKSGRIYRQDFQKYRNWQRIINERPLHIVFFEQMKKAVKKDPSCVLSEFYLHYPTFTEKGCLFEMCVRVLRYEFFSNNQLPKPLPSHFHALFLAVRERNKLPIPSFEFIRRTIAFQKYNLLTELLFASEGEESRQYIHIHRNKYTELERPDATFFKPPQDGNGTSPILNDVEDEDGMVVVSVNNGEEERDGRETGGPEVKGDDWLVD